MIDEMTTLDSIQTSTPVPYPLGKSIVGCQSVFTIKVGPNDHIDCLKAHLVKAIVRFSV